MIGGDHPVMCGVLVDLDGAEKATLLVLAAHADKAGRCWPSVRKLMRVLGYSERTTRRALAGLRGRGLIAVAEWRYTQNAGTVYRLHLPPDTSGTHPLTSVAGAPPDVDGTSPLTPVAEPPDTSGRQKNQEEPPEEPRAPAARPALHQRSPHRETAEAILREWWERQNPRPAQPYPACRQILERALDAGWTADELRSALPDLPTISGGTLDYWRSKRNRTNGHRPQPTAAAGEAAARNAMGLR